MIELFVVVCFVWAGLVTWRQIRQDRRLRDLEYKTGSKR